IAVRSGESGRREIVEQRLPLGDTAARAFHPRLRLVRRDLERPARRTLRDPALEVPPRSRCSVRIGHAVAVSRSVDRDGGETQVPDEPPREAENVRYAFVLRAAVTDEDRRNG